MAKKKEYTVYLLRNTDTGEIEYVGCSSRVKTRYYQHIKVEKYGKDGKRYGHGKFYGRTNLELVSVKTFSIKTEALLYEGSLKNQYGFKWTEKNTVPKEFHVFYAKNKKLVGKYKSYYDALKDLGFNNGNMAQVISGKRKQTGGYYGIYV